ncbi:MAG: hypothetical protein LWW77_04720 [Propionibacteriales bacterium]|nr:hypothetical protein [Propionibacteriales bacterium]
MNRRRLLLIAAIWLATVITASTATWAVISATGTKVGQTIPLSAPASWAATPSAAGTPSSSATPSHAPSSASPTSGSHPSTKPTHSRTTATDEPAETISRSWSGEAGTVTASCTGSAISLVSAVPSVGYRVHVERNTSSLEIEFESTSRDGHETHLKASCTDGVPTFRND